MMNSLARRTPRHLDPRVREAVLGALLAVRHGPAELRVPRAAEPLAPALLARSHERAAREAARELYERCLAHYRAQHGSGDDDDDAAAAAAHYVAANLHALSGSPVAPALLPPLQRQLAGIVAVGNDWAAGDLRARQVLFEKLATVAVLVGESTALAVEQGPAALANLRRAARNYLRELLGVEAERLQIGADGLALRSAN